MHRTLSNIDDNLGCNDGNLTDIIPTEEDSNLFEECLDVMVCVAEVSDEISDDNYPTINRAITFFIWNPTYNSKKNDSRTVTGAELFSIHWAMNYLTNGFLDVEEWWMPMH